MRCRAIVLYRHHNGTIKLLIEDFCVILQYADSQEIKMVARAGIEPTANCLEGSFILSSIKSENNENVAKM